MKKSRWLRTALLMLMLVMAYSPLKAMAATLHDIVFYDYTVGFEKPVTLEYYVGTDKVANFYDYDNCLYVNYTYDGYEYSEHLHPNSGYNSELEQTVYYYYSAEGYHDQHLDVNYEVPSGGFSAGTDKITVYYNSNKGRFSIDVDAVAVPKAVGLEYEGKSLEYYIGMPYAEVGHFYEAGSTVYIVYDDGSREKYVFVDDENNPGFYPDGEVEVGWENQAYFYPVVPQGGFTGDSDSIQITYTAEYGGDEYQIYGDVSAKAVPKPLSFEYKGNPLTFYPGSYPDHFMDVDNEIEVTYSDGTVKTLICKKYIINGDQEYTGYFPDGEVEYYENNNTNKVDFYLRIPDEGLTKETESVSVTGYFKYGEDWLELIEDVAVSPVPYPVAMDYAGEDLIAYAGDSILANLDTPGNAITVTYSDGSKVEYICTEYTITADGEVYTETGFFPDGIRTVDEDGIDNNAYLTANIPDEGITEDMTEVELQYREYYDSTLEIVKTTVPLKVKLRTDVDLQTDWYEYTGENFRPEVLVYDMDSQRVPETEYTVEYPENTADAGIHYVTVKSNADSRYYFSKKLQFEVAPKEIIPKVTLSKSEFVYNGKVQKPTVTVKDGSRKLTSSDYKVTYSSGCKSVGAYKAAVTLKGNYKGSKKVTFKIVPKGTSLSSVSAASRGFTAKWKKQAAQTSGYQLQYSTSSSFKSGNKQVFITKNTTLSKKITGLKAKKKYYVRVRTYKTVSGTKYYSAWSTKKYVITKP